MKALFPLWVRAFRALTLTAVIASAIPAASAEPAGKYPANPVRMIVPYPPGGPTDIAGRIAAEELTRALDVSIVVENKPGAGGMTGADMVARGRPDGSILLVNASAHVIYPAIFKQVNFDVIDSFTPVTQLVQVPLILLVPASLPVNNVKELIQYIKSRPGKVSFASAGNGGAPHLAAELFKKEAGVDILHVPYKGSAPALTDLMSGQVQMMFDSVTSSSPYVKAGKLKALAVTTPERSSMMPDVPTMREAGLPSYVLTNWYGLWAPKGTPKPVVDLLARTLSKTFHSPEITRKLNAIGAEPVISTPDEFARFVVEEKEHWGKIARDSGATMN